MNLLGLSKVNKYFGERCLFENVSFSVEDHDKVGLIGANGTGKTTLFHMILDGAAPDGGDIFVPRQTKFGYLEQHIGTDSDKNVYDELLTIFSRVQKLEEQILNVTGAIEAGIGNPEENAEKLHVLTEQFEALGGYTYKNMAKSALLGMGFQEEDLNKPFSALSGGEKTRVCLCKLLLSEANLLLLDEPTNHLDIQSVEWLEGFLQSYKGAFIVISHDRYFLDKVTNKTFELENARLNCYDGNYSVYQKQKKENEKYIARRYENTMREINRIEGIIEQQRRWNRERNIKTAESKQKMVDRLKADLVVPQEELDSIKPRFQIAKTGGNDVAEAVNLSKGFHGRQLFCNVNFLLRRKERAFLLGANGCGKTTLFKIMTNALEPDSGSVSIGANVDIGYFDQTQETLDHSKTIFDEISDAYPSLSNTEIRNALAGFLFVADDVFKRISELSGGERARLMLLKLMLKKANFLLLDEPTNHLDIQSREMLEDALSEYDGTIFAISHDRYFINKLANRILLMENEVVMSFPGNYSYYLEKYGEENKADGSGGKEKSTTSGKEDYLRRKQLESEQRKRKNRLEQLERDIEALENDIEAAKAELEKPETASDYVKCAEISQKLDEMNETLLSYYSEWDTLQENTAD